MDIKQERPDWSTVSAHYDALADVYNQGANRHCNRAYAVLIQAALQDCRRVLELGAGSYPQSIGLSAAAVLCDLSAGMLRRAPSSCCRTQADAQCLPFPDGVFDGLVSVNLLEHVPEPARLFAEAARVLQPGGRAVFITPNGDQRRLLAWLETLRLKLPEGPHRFLGRTVLLALGEDAGFHCRAQEVFLAFPAISSQLTRLADRLAQPLGFGLFQYIILER